MNTQKLTIGLDLLGPLPGSGRRRITPMAWPLRAAHAPPEIAGITRVLDEAGEILAEDPNLLSPALLALWKTGPERQPLPHTA